MCFSSSSINNACFLYLPFNEVFESINEVIPLIALLPFLLYAYVMLFLFSICAISSVVLPFPLEPVTPITYFGYFI